MPAPQSILDLIARFEANLADYRSGHYNETQVRREFVDPFFKALGWDIDNEQGYAERYKDVIHEDAIRVADSVKAPDYAFRIGGVRRFFVETKKPAVNVKEDIHPAYQLRRYAWSAKLPLSILTDFEEFAVYDCRVQPNKSDKASTARTLYLTYRDYAKRWDEITAIFSREAILKGAFDRYAESSKKRGTAEVDDAFLAEMDEWRLLLARNLALRNPDLTQRELNFAVQMVIDRIIFLRIAEDRGIEPAEQLRNLSRGKGIYDGLRVLFERADQKYNSGLFHFHTEPGRADFDTLTPGLDADDDTLHHIIRRLYYPESPYVFSQIPPDILGQVYERFLGKVIRLTKGHRATVEDKPEVRKAGGVYYTPTYIVDYIVKNTVGKLLEGKTPASAADLRVLDPACGSGSFLIGAYQYLLDWHRDQYLAGGPENHAKGRQPRLVQTQDGDWKLTIDEKKRILLDHIHGVDIDSQAVEVTKLSLLLKVLEGEAAGAGQIALLTTERLLPDLDGNIKCGNSLIGPDFYAASPQQLGLFGDEEEAYRINVFDWNSAFPKIMQRGGFDAVIGNPPYIRIQALKEWAPVEVEFYKQAYRAAGKGNYDIYVVFVEKGLGLLNGRGRLGFILPHKFFNAQYGEPLRGLIAEGRHLAGVVHFGDQQVFKGATTYTCLLFLEKAGAETCEMVKVDDLAAWRTQAQDVARGSIPAQNIAAKEWNFVVGQSRDLFDRLHQMPVRLGDIAHIFVGTQTSADDVFVLDECHHETNYIIGISKALSKEVKVEIACTRPFLRGKQIRRYESPNSSSYLVCPYEISEHGSRLLTKAEFLSQYPLALAYLEENMPALRAREKGKFDGQNWYAFGYPKSMNLFQKPKIIVPDYNNIASFTFDPDGYFYKTGYGAIVSDPVLSPIYVLGLLNSPLLFGYLLSIGTSLRGGYIRFWTQFIEQLPIRTIDFADPADRARHDRMVTLVEGMLDLHKRLPAARTPQDRALLQRQIEATDRQIDALVYELYDLTDEEIRIVEGATGR